MRLRHRSVAATVLTAGLWAVPIGAQAPEGSRFLTVQAVAESLKVLSELQTSVRKHYNNAEAWYHQGLIATALYERCRVVPKLPNLDCTRPRQLADTALMIAGELDPQNRQYILALGRFLLAADVTFFRDGTYFTKLFGAALATAKRSGDPMIYSDAMVDMGRYYWLEYDAQAHRPGYATPGAPGMRVVAPTAGGRATSGLRLTGQSGARRTTEFSGEISYLLAQMLYQRALAVAPANVRAYRGYATLLAEHNRWLEVGAAARERIAAVPADGWAWMTLAMATYRSGDVDGAAVTFDSALRLLPADERAQYVGPGRLFTSSEQRKLNGMTPDQRAYEQRLYWRNANPLWSADGDLLRLEFLARVAYSELVWTSDELRQHGADSDRGEVYIRMGPPDSVISGRGTGCDDSDPGCVLPPGYVAPPGTSPPCGRIMQSPGAVFFMYSHPAGVFRFPRVPLYGCRLFYGDSLAHQNIEAHWDNVVIGRIDSIPIQFARFRGSPDSTDVFFGWRSPMAEIANATDVAGSVRTDMWLLDPTAAVIYRDSQAVRSDGLTTHTARVAAGRYVYRLEAGAPGSLVHGRATAAFIAGDDSRTGFRSAGFGTSDIVLATNVEGEQRSTLRWSDLRIEPITGAVARGAQLTVVWENYDFAADSGRARYAVQLTVKRQQADTSTAPNIAAQIVDGIVGALGVRREQAPNSVVFGFERRVPHAPIMLDRFTVSLGTTPAGDYLVTLMTTDLVTGAQAGRSQLLRIVDEARGRAR